MNDAMVRLREMVECKADGALPEQALVDLDTVLRALADPRNSSSGPKRYWRERAEASEALLREVEWSAAGEWIQRGVCPICKQARAKGHAPDCRLAAALERATG